MNKQIIFGTDGIRGKATEFPFTQDGLNRIGNAIGMWATKKYKRFQPRLLIATDTRESGIRIKENLINCLLQFPLEIVDAFVLSTPAVCQFVCKSGNFDFGIVVSASHNPYYDNGIKLFDGTTCKLSLEDEKIILGFINAQESYVGSGEAQGKVSLWEKAYKNYYDTIKSYFNHDFLRDITIVIDCAHGATSNLAQQIFEFFGARVIALADMPTGTNINDGCGTLHPEFLKEHVLANKADIGFAFDGDGDRIICVNRHGAVKDGDDILFLLTQHVNYHNSKEFVGTIMSNSGFEDYLIACGKKLVRTNVGDKYVVAALEERGLLLGGEVSGHIIARDYLATGDGIFVALRVLESIIQEQNWEVKTFERKPQVLLNVPIKKRDDLAKDPYRKIIQDYEQKLQKGRILVRFSGTEDILRVMVEDMALHNTQHIAEELASALVNALQQTTMIAGAVK